MAFGQGGQSQHQGSGGVSGSYRTGSRQERTGEQEEDMHQLRQQRPHLLQSRLPKLQHSHEAAGGQGGHHPEVGGVAGTGVSTVALRDGKGESPN